ncbi:hypothetical protein U879_05620 [Defluviimonas sp. 20V17]|uniref:Uncharacterized conserved protein, MAPEG superfamily n=1 Tax=Allgaiera indica TaxID=765699 RepID=A0AAN5A1A4_9RHOB|nr:hypothetical protein [Allgaiera indica]KDB04658.1 hypothetical protein U879_05620 [Defluviimonas sp. 20V17]GHE06005.1 hypothetical protein GCM10008024_38960 [Allgaiera indica]SDX82775.1 Uncharacterized conserved protein, MAPEG superfamily [Allgaiera indica]
MTLGTLVLLVLALYIFQLFMQELSGWGRDPGALLRPRDESPARATLAVRLATRQGQPARSPAAVPGPHDTGRRHGRSAVPGASVVLAARMLYVPAYASGLPALRSMTWLWGWRGLR